MLSYIPTILAIITVIKILVLYKASKAQKEYIAEIIKKEKFSKENIDKQVLSYFNLVKEIANRFIILTNYKSNPSLIN